jgi:formylglycine-generating enzyme required for sulfatase activity
MAFDLDRWQSDVRNWWAEHGPRIKTMPIKSAYAVLAASAWLPFLTALIEEPGTATTELVGITAGIGSNLVANVVQGIYDRARGGQQAATQAQEDPQIRAELEAVLNATHALEAAREALGEEWSTFARQLEREMEAMPGQSRLIITGSTVGGSVVAGDLTMKDSTFVGGDQTTMEGDGNVPGDGSRATVIKTGDHSPVTYTEDRRAEEEARRQERALHAYLARVIRECNTLSLRGMDPKAADVTEKESMSLDAVYTALDTGRRVPLSGEELAALKDKEQGRFTIVTGGELRGERPQRPMSALEVASEIDRLVLLGDPGAGKSTFVNYLALRLACAASGQDVNLPGWTRGSLIPVRVVLRDVARSPHLSESGTAAALWAFIEESLVAADLADAAPALKERLDGRVILLLDGLDEVDAEARPRVLDAVNDFALTYGQTPMLVTCRIYAYQERAWKLDGFEEATLASFDEEKIDHFIQGWYIEVARMGLLSDAEAGERADRLRQAVRRPDLRPLAPNPLLLTMMALLHSSWGRLPEDRVQLYDEIVELLLARWEQSRLGREALTRARLSPRDLRFALEEVAYDAHRAQEDGEGTADVTEARLREILARGYLEGDWARAGDVIRYVRERAGLLLERMPGVVYAFPHRTLQEYLAGCHLSVQEDFPSRAADLLQEDETRWREVFLLAVGKTGRAENRVDLALGAVNNLCPRECRAPADEAACRCAWLAGQALVEIGVDKLRRREAWAVWLEWVAGWLAELVEAGMLTPVERADAGRVLGRLGDPRSLDAVVHVPGGPFLMGSTDEDEEAYDDEKPQHTVEVDGFFIGRYPVTNRQYARFVDTGGYDERRYWTELGWAWRVGEYTSDVSYIEDEEVRGRVADWLAGRPPEERDRPFWWHSPTWNPPNLPVVGVCWFEALAYTRWLTERLQREGCALHLWEGDQFRVLSVSPGALAARLPTEAEWEKASRGTDGRIYPWGNEEIAPERANYDQAGVGRTSPVGSFPAGVSPYGALDMVGNVWEWCSSVGFSEAPYPYRGEDGREDVERDVVRALRGGAWLNDRRDARCAVRNDNDPDYFTFNIGFRVVFPGSLSDF